MHKKRRISIEHLDKLVRIVQECLVGSLLAHERRKVLPTLNTIYEKLQRGRYSHQPKKLEEDFQTIYEWFDIMYQGIYKKPLSKAIGLI